MVVKLLSMPRLLFLSLTLSKPEQIPKHSFILLRNYRFVLENMRLFSMAIEK